SWLQQVLYEKLSDPELLSPKEETSQNLPNLLKVPTLDSLQNLLRSLVRLLRHSPEFIGSLTDTLIDLLSKSKGIQHCHLSLIKKILSFSLPSSDAWHHSYDGTLPLSFLIWKLFP